MGVEKLFVLIGCLTLGTSYTVQPLQDFPILDNKPREVSYSDDGIPVSVRCPVLGQTGKDFKFSWLKNGKRFEVDNKSVFFLNPLNDTLVFPETIFTPKMDPAGTYQCLVKTAMGTAKSGPIYVKKYFFDTSSIVYHIATHRPVEGDPFEIDCPEVKAYPKPKIQWVKWYSLDNYHPINNTRYTAAPNGKLYFSNITEADVKDFKYVCLAESPILESPELLAEHYMASMRNKTESRSSQPKHKAQYVSSDVVTRLGEDTLLYCIYGGTPLAQIQWYFNGTNLSKRLDERVRPDNKGSGNILRIAKTRATDEGTYHCRFVDSNGENVSSSINVTVVSPPTFIQELQPKIVAKEFSDLTIDCLVHGIPKPRISWTYNNWHIPISMVKFIGPLENGDRLYMKFVQKSDQGFYGCTAANDNGFVYSETYLSVN